MSQDQSNPSSPVPQKRRSSVVSFLMSGSTIIVAVLLIFFGFSLFRIYFTSEGRALRSNQTKVEAAMVTLKKCALQLQVVNTAIIAYQAEHKNAYPKDLKELTPKYLKDLKQLHCPADTRPVDLISYTYTAPKPTDSPETTFFTCTYHQLNLSGEEVSLVLLVRKNGEVWQRTVRQADTKIPPSDLK